MSEKEEMPVEEVPGEPNEVKEVSAETAVTDETSESQVKDATAKESTEEPESTKSTAADADEGHHADQEVVPVGLCKPYLQTLEFVVPDGAVAGQEIPVKTPTGMVNAVVPEGQQPGDRCAMEVPVPGAFVLTVPDGAVEGATFSFESAGVMYNAVVPAGKGPGDTFTVGSQPPEGTEPLQKVFQHYASLAKAALRKASHLFDPEPTAPMIAMAHAVPPQEITFIVPDGVTGGELITVQGPVGPLVVTVPEGRKAGDEVSAPLCPPSEGFTVTVPEGVGEGEVVAFEDPQGVKREAQVPAGKQPGDSFEIFPPSLMVQVPQGTRAGDRVAFRTVDGRELVGVVPQGFEPGSFFAAHI